MKDRAYKEPSERSKMHTPEILEKVHAISSKNYASLENQLLACYLVW